MDRSIGDLAGATRLSEPFSGSRGPWLRNFFSVSVQVWLDWNFPSYESRVDGPTPNSLLIKVFLYSVEKVGVRIPLKKKEVPKKSVTLF